MSGQSELDFAVSAIVPVHDSEKWLGSTVPSILASLRKEDEVIFVDDNSSDTSLSILKTFESQDRRVRVLANPERGLVQALNYGISQSKHNLIARFDSDDLYNPLRIRLQIELFMKGYALVFSDYLVFDDTNRYFGRFLAPRDSFRTYLSFAASRRTAHPVALFSRKAFIEVGGYLMDDYPNEDLSLWLRICNRYPAASVQFPLLSYRVHNRAISATLRRRQKAGIKVLIKKHFSEERLLQLQATSVPIDVTTDRFPLELTYDVLDSFALLRIYPFNLFILKQFLKDLLAFTRHFLRSIYSVLELFRLWLSKTTYR